ncbi:hypothetical protein F5X71_12825 [Nocardia brasiliensis]|uniref:Uncharacterized protein n=1 Tax=Nocardia brasiliensis TaxID=37326 RepID=A0A6G9XQ80_NOCBR|nr:hypothetical protein [Nocardia brasiliensis]QIS03078.1 hypothetical protein F5X71_12825 [Nocardia brasiliensis]
MVVRAGTLVPALLCAAALAGSGQAQASADDSGGCRVGSMMSGRLVPGTGSVGQSIRREVDLRECTSPLLPGVDAARVTVTVPFNAPGALSTAELAWSDGTRSTATGYGNGLWAITTGPATGHAIHLHTADTWNGWYLSYADVLVTSATFIA